MSSDLCFIVDVNIAWISKALKRRGFIVFEPVKDYPETMEDHRILLLAQRTGCFVVSHDRFFEGKEHAVYVPHSWEKKYNSWEIVTKVVKEAANARKKILRSYSLR